MCSVRATCQQCKYGRERLRYGECKKVVPSTREKRAQQESQAGQSKCVGGGGAHNGVEVGWEARNYGDGSEMPGTAGNTVIYYGKGQGSIDRSLNR
jgi:hypothetical protein